MSGLDRPLTGGVAVPTNMADLVLVKNQLLGFMDIRGYGSADCFAVGLALDEALTNAATHGNRGDSAKRVLVSYSVGRDDVCVEIQDEGTGFRPDEVPDPRLPEYVDKPHGRGLLMMRLYMTDIEYNARGNKVRMRKDRSVSCDVANSA